MIVSVFLCKDMYLQLECQGAEVKGIDVTIVQHMREEGETNMCGPLVFPSSKSPLCVLQNSQKAQLIGSIRSILSFNPPIPSPAL